MKVIRARNVNDAFLLGIDLFQDPRNFREQESRNGTTFESLEPVTTVYEKPWERVLLLKIRDANPFFHFIEGLWMLAGRNDLEPLTRYVKSMEDFSDDGETLWGAYGWRWRTYFGRDQLKTVIEMLRKNPNDRRCVLQMWDAYDDLDKNSKDVPCNTTIYFKIRDEKLHMTVCNRSNDMLWGAYGANAVHMSMLQEYIAGHLEVSMGTYRQVSDSFHVYHNEVWERVKDVEIDPLTYSSLKNPYDLLEGIPYTNFITNPKVFDWELDRFFHIHPEDMASYDDDTWDNPAFKNIAVPMVKAFNAHKKRDYELAYGEVMRILPNDWMTACFDWIKKRDLSWTLNNKKGDMYGK
jgi:thymidylate synthase|tara:strand:- start:163 stop:1215 length:1053 start_codon:yes stop_codon:yes gene_type:complete